jgi:hypothetical protein
MVRSSSFEDCITAPRSASIVHASRWPRAPSRRSALGGNLDRDRSGMRRHLLRGTEGSNPSPSSGESDCNTALKVPLGDRVGGAVVVSQSVMQERDDVAGGGVANPKYQRILRGEYHLAKQIGSPSF